MNTINLTRNKETTVCDCHYELVSGYKWHYSSVGYAVRFVNRKAIYMHRVLAGAEKGMDVDHMNMDKLDNRCTNIRIVTRRQNCLNKNVQENNTSGYRGVSWSKPHGKWFAQIINNQKKTYLGLFDDVKDAARAYNKEAVIQHGEFARLNEGI